MEDLAYEYPAEPVERAAARFLEAIAAWRGKPELEGVSVFFFLEIIWFVVWGFFR